MTTYNFYSKICTFKILLSWRFPQKAAFWTIFLSAPPKAKKKNYCRLAVSEIFSGKYPWFAPSRAECPGFLVLGSAPAPASTLVSEPQIVPLG